MTNWDGKERRMSSEDHDILIEIRRDVKNLIQNFESHTKDDKEQFKIIARENEWTKKILYGGIGVVVFVEFVMKFIQ